MTITQLRYLLAIIEHGGFVRAADQCHVTQPTMSAQIKKLEDELGVLLFERTGAGIHVTPVGEQIVQHTRVLIEQAQAIKWIARGSGGFPAGHVRLGVISSAAPAMLTTAIRAIQEKLKELTIDVREGSPSDLIAELKDHTIDLIIGTMPDEEPGLRWLPLFWEPYILFSRSAQGRAPRHRGRKESGLPRYMLDEGGAVEVLSAGRPTSLEVGLHDHMEWQQERARNISSIATLNALLSSRECEVVLPLTASLMISASRLSRMRIGSPNVGRTVGFVWRTSFPWTRRCYEIYDIVHSNLPDGVVVLDKNAPS